MRFAGISCIFGFDLFLQDGAFLIRHSSAQSSRQPYTLAVLYEDKVYNIPIRFLEELRGYALGKEGKTNEEVKRAFQKTGKKTEEFKLCLFDVLFFAVSDFLHAWWDDFTPPTEPAASDKQPESGQAHHIFNPSCLPMKSHWRVRDKDNEAAVKVSHLSDTI